MQKGKQALLLHLGVCLRLCNYHLIALSPLASSDHGSPTPPSTPYPIFSPLILSSLFSFIPAISVLFSDFLPYVRNIHLPLLYSIYFIFFLPFFPDPHTPLQLIFVTFSLFLCPCRHAPVLMWELQYWACGVVALAWGSVLRPRGVLLLWPLWTGDTGQCAGLAH